MFNIFQFFKKAKSNSSVVTLESSLRKDEDPDINNSGIYTINKVLDDSGLRTKVDDIRTLESNIEKTRDPQEDKIMETKLNEAEFRSAIDDLQIPLVNVMSMNNDKKNNELFIEAMGEVNVNDNIFKKYIGSQLNREPHMIQNNIKNDRSELPNNYKRLKDEGFIPDYHDDFNKNNDEITDMKPIKLEKIASALEKICKIDETILLEMIDSKKQGKLADPKFLRYAESRKREILSPLLGVNHEEEDDFDINHHVMMQKYKSQLSSS